MSMPFQLGGAGGYVREPRYGLYMGKVSNVDDPKNMGRVKLIVPSVLEDSEETGWAMPCIPLIRPVNVREDTAYTPILREVEPSIPVVGQHVWVMFEGGNVDKPVYMGTWWLVNQAPPVG